MRRIALEFFLALTLIGCQSAPAATPTTSTSIPPSPTAALTMTSSPTRTVLPTPTTSSVELKRRASPICENAFSALVESGPLLPPYAVLKKPTYAAVPSWELSHPLPHLSSISAPDVQTVFCISETRTQTGTYTDGSAAYQLFWEVRAVSWPGGKVIGRRSFTGSPPPGTKELASDSAEGSTPYKEFAVWVLNQVEHPDFLFFNNAITSIAISPDGQLAAFGTAIASQIVDQEYQATLYLFNPSDVQTDAGTSSYLKVLDGHEGMVTSLAFSPDGTILASSGYDRFVKFWDVSRAQLLGQTSIADTPNALAFSADGKTLAVISNLEVTILDAVSRQIVTSILGAGGGRVAYSPDGSHIYVHSSGTIKIIDPSAGRVTLTFPDRFALVPTVSVASDGSVTGVSYESPEVVEDFVLSPDGTQVFTYTIDRSLESDAGAENVRLAAWNTRTGQYVSEVRFSGDAIHAIRISPDGKLLAIGNRNEIWIWDRANWQVKKILSGHTGEIVDLAFTSQGTKLLSASRDGTLRVWSLEE